MKQKERIIKCASHESVYFPRNRSSIIVSFQKGIAIAADRSGRRIRKPAFPSAPSSRLHFVHRTITSASFFSLFSRCSFVLFSSVTISRSSNSYLSLTPFPLFYTAGFAFFCLPITISPYLHLRAIAIVIPMPSSAINVATSTTRPHRSG